VRAGVPPERTGFFNTVLITDILQCNFFYKNAFELLFEVVRHFLLSSGFLPPVRMIFPEKEIRTTILGSMIRYTGPGTVRKVKQGEDIVLA
jgi:hypothetical protein